MTAVEVRFDREWKIQVIYSIFMFIIYRKTRQIKIKENKNMTDFGKKWDGLTNYAVPK